MAILDRTNLKALIQSNLPDNVTEAITPQKHREVADAIADSMISIISDVSRYFLNDWSTSISYPVGSCVVAVGSGTNVGDIFQCNVPNSTIGTFISSEWDIISTYIPDASTSGGLDAYLRKENGIELNDKKYIELVDNTSLKGLDSGYYKVTTSTTANIGLDKDYPETGDASYSNILGDSTANSVNFYINHSTGNSYIRVENGNWTQLNSETADYIEGSGISVLGDNSINLGGAVTGTTLLNGDDINSANIWMSNLANIILEATQITLNTQKVYLPNIQDGTGIKTLAVDSNNNIVKISNNTSSTGEILTITDSNKSSYWNAFEDLYIKNVPNSTTIISIETSTVFNDVIGVAMETTPFNGQKLRIIGNIEYRSTTGTDPNTFTQYIYQYLSSNGGTPARYIPTNNLDAWVEFMYWNGTWYLPGY